MCMRIGLRDLFHCMYYNEIREDNGKTTIQRSAYFCDILYRWDRNFRKLQDIFGAAADPAVAAAADGPGAGDAVAAAALFILPCNGRGTRCFLTGHDDVTIVNVLGVFAKGEITEVRSNAGVDWSR